MTHTSSQNLGEQFEQCTGIIRQASKEILMLLNVHLTKGRILAGFLNNSILHV